MRHLSRIVVACALAALAWSVAAWDAARLQAQAAKRSVAVQQQVTALVALVGQGGKWTPEERARRVNRFFNERVEWREDQQIWSKVDYWASPMEMFDKAAGDCEDLAMGKYFTLLGLGLPSSSLRLVYVKAQFEGRSQAHMVLAWYPQPGAEPMILDNINPEMLPASQRGDLQPVFSFNAEGLWQGVGAQGAGNPLARLGIWRDALERAKAEGF
jgi:predicted transglutaminase-like cysteine proteinase